MSEGKTDETMIIRQLERQSLAAAVIAVHIPWASLSEVIITARLQTHMAEKEERIVTRQSGILYFESDR